MVQGDPNIDFCPSWPAAENPPKVLAVCPKTEVDPVAAVVVTVVPVALFVELLLLVPKLNAFWEAGVELNVKLNPADDAEVVEVCRIGLELLSNEKEPVLLVFAWVLWLVEAPNNELALEGAPNAVVELPNTVEAVEDVPNGDEAAPNAVRGLFEPKSGEAAEVGEAKAGVVVEELAPNIGVLVVEAAPNAGLGAAVVDPNVGVGAAEVTPNAGVGATVVVPNAGVGAMVVAPNAGVGAAVVAPNAGLGANVVDPNEGVGADVLVEVVPNAGVLLAKVKPNFDDADPKVPADVVVPYAGGALAEEPKAGRFVLVAREPKTKPNSFGVGFVTVEVLFAASLNVNILVGLDVGTEAELVLAASFGLNVNGVGMLEVAGVEDWGREAGVGDLPNVNTPGAGVAAVAAVPKVKLLEVVVAVEWVAVEV